MSEQIREQVSAFLDGELPNSETELLLKRLTRDEELRESFARYALIGEAVRGASISLRTKGFASRVNLAIDGESVPADTHVPKARAPHWWRPFAGAAVAAGVTAVAVVAFQQRAAPPALRPVTAQNATVQTAAVASRSEDLSYTVPPTTAAVGAMMAPARLTKYVFAHSRYSSALDQRGLVADMLIEADEQQPTIEPAAARTSP